MSTNEYSTCILIHAELINDDGYIIIVKIMDVIDAISTVN